MFPTVCCKCHLQFTCSFPAGLVGTRMTMHIGQRALSHPVQNANLSARLSGNQIYQHGVFPQSLGWEVLTGDPFYTTINCFSLP